MPCISRIEIRAASVNPFEIYRFTENGYELLKGNPIGLPEIGLSLWYERGVYLGREREWLYWYDEAGNRLVTPEEKADQAEERQARAERLANKLRELGINPDSI